MDAEKGRAGPRALPYFALPWTDVYFGWRLGGLFSFARDLGAVSLCTTRVTTIEGHARSGGAPGEGFTLRTAGVK